MLWSLLFSGASVNEILLGVLYTIPAVLIALTFHEFAHAFVAYKLGDPTAKLAGRMNIDPTKHLDLLGTVCMLLVGWGWAKPVPINTRNFKHPKRDEILVSVSGAAMNLIIGFAACGIMFFLFSFNMLNNIGHSLLSYMITLNVYLAVFNILPIPPLDGFHVLSALCIRRKTQVVTFLYKYGFIILIVLIVTRVVGYVCGGLSGIIISGYESFFGMFL